MKGGETIYEKLNEIFMMVDFIMEHGGDEDECDTVTLYQCELPYRLKEVETDLRTMFE
jgi:hypothetical protein